MRTFEDFLIVGQTISLAQVAKLVHPGFHFIVLETFGET